MGTALLHKLCKKQWNNGLVKAIVQLRRLFNFNHLYIGGGNAKKVRLKLPPWSEIVQNVACLWGGSPYGMNGKGSDTKPRENLSRGRLQDNDRRLQSQA